MSAEGIIGSPAHVDLWRAINEFANARIAFYGTVKRQEAVAQIERALEALLAHRASGEGGSTSALRASAPEGQEAAKLRIALRYARRCLDNRDLNDSLSIVDKLTMGDVAEAKDMIAELCESIDHAIDTAASVEAGPSSALRASAPEGLDCPFCGHEPAIENLRSSIPVYPLAMRIRCSDCGASAGVVMGTDHDAALLKAWSMWDRRFSPQAEAKAIPSSASPPSSPEGTSESPLEQAMALKIAVRSLRMLDDSDARAMDRICQGVDALAARVNAAEAE